MYVCMYVYIYRACSKTGTATAEESRRLPTATNTTGSSAWGRSKGRGPTLAWWAIVAPLQCVWTVTMCVDRYNVCVPLKCVRTVKMCVDHYNERSECVCCIYYMYECIYTYIHTPSILYIYPYIRVSDL